MSARYWSPKFGTVLRHTSGQTVMMIAGVEGGGNECFYLSGDRKYAGRTFLSTGFMFRSDNYAWRRIKKGGEE